MLFDLPTSISEARFWYRITAAAKNPGKAVSLPDLMPGSWETVCGTNCYHGDVHVKRYGKTYPYADSCSRRAWGLLFIERDGSYTAVSGNCNWPGVMVDVPTCRSRSAAPLRLSISQYPCATYFLDGGKFVP
jgi:hypothetical protein